MARKKTIAFETTFTRYTATGFLGEGGAGRIYKATDDAGLEVAIKLLDPLKANGEKRRRFKNELSFGLKFQHPNVITTLDHGLFIEGDKSSPFYVMPLYSGSLRVLMEKGISTDNILPYFSQLLDGVEAAHLKKVIHRDLKPENILYDLKENRLLVADFGTAHFEEEELFTLVETAPNTRLANFQYAAPEQRRRGLQVDHRADIYALGLMLNEMFTGDVPQGTGYRTISNVAPEYSYLDELISAMIRHSSADRPASIEEVKLQLIGRKQEFVTQQRISALDQTVIPTTDIDDPLIADPPRLVNFDYKHGTLTLVLSRKINANWIEAFRDMRSHTSVWGKGPERFSISGAQASISAQETEIQRIIDYFKEWLPQVNRIYEERVHSEKEETERQLRMNLQRQVEEEHRRQRVLNTIKI